MVVGLFLFPPWWTVADVLTNIYILLYVGVLIGAGIVAARCTPDGVHDQVPAADANRT